MNKQTAVEKFIEQLEEQGESWENVSIGRIQISIKVEDYLDLIKQAKEMEKEQISESYRAGVEDERYEHLKLHGDYYKKTYGNNK